MDLHNDDDPPPYDDPPDNIIVDGRLNRDPMDIDPMDEDIEQREQHEEQNIITIKFVDPIGELCNINIPFPNLNIVRVDRAAKNVIHDYIRDNQGICHGLNLTYYVLDRCEFYRVDDRNYVLRSREGALVDRDPPIAHQGVNKRELDVNEPHNNAKRRKRGGSKLRKSKRRKSKSKRRKRKSKTRRRRR